MEQGSLPVEHSTWSFPSSAFVAMCTEHWCWNNPGIKLQFNSNVPSDSYISPSHTPTIHMGKYLISVFQLIVTCYQYQLVIWANIKLACRTFSTHAVIRTSWLKKLKLQEQKDCALSLLICCLEYFGFNPSNPPSIRYPLWRHLSKSNLSAVDFCCHRLTS